MQTAQPFSEVSRHKCLIYDGDPSEQLPVVVPLLLDGLRDNQRCMYLGSPETIAMIDSALAHRGIDVAAETERGALIFSADRSHLEGGRFDPRAMVAMLRTTIDDAVRDGFAGLCATGDMMWELGSGQNFESLLEYEALLDQVFREKPLRGICQYNRRVVPAHAVHDALLTHRSAYIGRELNTDNLFYVPPEILLAGREGSTRETQGEWMCQQIIRILAAERKRDQALAALRESEAEQRRLALDLARANEGLELRVRERTAELEALNKDLESFSYSVSHDLRAPLRAIGGFARVLQERHADVLPPEGRTLLDRIGKGAAQAHELIDGLLLLSRLGRQALTLQAIDVASVVRDVLEGFAGDPTLSRCEVVIGELPPANGDATLVRQVFANLISNALKFSRAKDTPCVWIGSLTEDDRRVYFVRDNGAGFSMRYAGKLFGAFQRLHRAEEFEGIGIGLSIVHQVMRRHGVWAEAEEGRGATFYLAFGA